MVGGQRELEDRFENVMSKKNDLRGPGRAMAEQRANMQREGLAAAGDLKNSTHVFARSLKQSPLTPDNLEKVQADRFAMTFSVFPDFFLKLHCMLG